MTATISIVTPSLNTADALERTILSIVTQAGDFRIRYHVQDGGSDDGTLEMLARWQARLSDMRNPILCRDIWFSYASAPSTGTGATIAQGIDHMSGPAHGFTSWIRPGDVYLPGALGYVAQVAEQFTPDQASWIGGAVGIIRDHRLTGVLDIPMPSDLLALGLANGLHWPFQQQQGTFFRRALWAACHKALQAAPDSVLGEWALWQHMAKHAPLVQTPHALGAFRPRLQQRPLHRRIQARRQMIAQAPDANPEAALQAVLHRNAPLLRHILRDGASGAPMRIDAEDVTGRLHQWLSRTAEAQPPVAAPAPRIIATGQLPDHDPDRPPLARLTRDGDDSTALIFAEAFAYRDLLQTASDDVDAIEALATASAPLCQRHSLTSRPDPLWRGGRIWAWDLGWQTTPATEWRAFRQVQALVRVPQGTGYLGFPWASVMGTDAQDRAGLDRFCAALPPARQRITVCQHPDMLNHLGLLQQAGVTDVFWPYVTKAARTQAQAAGLRLHPFAQSFDQCLTTIDADAQDRPRADVLANISGTGSPECADTAAPTVETSLFALCPHGVGGNSLALWQAIAAGAIPVILTETAENPLSAGSLPGDPALWNTAVLLCPAEDVAGLPDRLRLLADTPQTIEALQQGLRQIRLLYGPKALTHDIQALMAAQTDQSSALPAAPARIGRLPRIYGLGQRFGRTPLGYAPLRRLAEDKVEFVTTPDTADLILTGWSRDFEDHAPLLSQTLRNSPSTRLAVISEEPLWDTVWSGGYTERDRLFECNGTPHPYRFLNHFNSGLFDFTHLPYFLLTADHYCARYVSMLARYAHVTPQALRRHWQDAPHAAAFAAEFRSDPIFDVTTPDGALQGLSGYRTRVAQLTPGMSVLRMGKGWPDTGPTRQSLPDWHLDKLARLDGQVRLCSAYENTHHSTYISEKLFDAFAVGGIPVCYAGPGHRLHDLVLPGAMVNNFGLPPEAAAEQLAGFSVDLARAEAWLETAAALRDRLGDSRKIAAERQRVVAGTLAELYALL